MKKRLFIKETYKVEHEVVIDTDLEEWELDIVINKIERDDCCLCFDDVVFTLADYCTIIEKVDGFESGNSKFECDDIEDED